jgi:GNAT superfamily N-acetyltransferase
MGSIVYKTGDEVLTAEEYCTLLGRSFDLEMMAIALTRTINITAREDDWLVGVASVLTDGYTFSTISYMYVHPEYRKKGIGSELVNRAFDVAPRGLFLGAQPGNEHFFESLGFEKSMQSYQKLKDNSRF